MKYILTLVCTILSLITSAQNGKISLDKGKKIIVKSSINQETDMGMGMEMKNATNTQYEILVTDITSTEYVVTNTMKGLKISIDAMGQSTSYDSDNKADSASELGKSVKKINIPDTVFLNKSTGTVISKKKEEPETKDDSNPFASMFESMGNEDQNIVKESIFIIPDGKKPGDKWSDSTITKDMKTYKDYTVQSIENGLATINVTGKVINNMQAEVQGMQVTISMDTKSTGVINVDTNTSLVNKRITNATITGTLEMMGQSVPVSGTANTSLLFEYQ